MSQVFGSVYAGAYDAMYHDKDYAAECAVVQRVFQKYQDGPIQSVLDLGCGTGNHVFPLAEKGYAVTGVDRSEGMLTRARGKADAFTKGTKPAFHQGDVRSVDMKQEFDAALMMFAVLGYQLENADVLAALKTARHHVRRGGLFVFDVWYGPAVLSERPTPRFRVIPTPGGRLLRLSSAQLDVHRQRSSVHFQLWQLEGDRLVSETQEEHSMRFFFPLELAFFLESAGLSLLRLGAFPEFDKDPSDTTWNVIGAARAV